VVQYSVTGRFVREWGRIGSGPGEYKSASGIVQIADGRVAIRDGANGRINLYSEDGRPDSSVPLTGISGYPDNGTNGLLTDGTGTLWVSFYGRRLTRAETDVGYLRPISYVRMLPTGRVLDTIEAPYPKLTRPPFVKIDLEGGYRFNPVPDGPSVGWAVHRDGYLINVVNTRYAIDLRMPGGKETGAHAARWLQSDPVISLRKAEVFPRRSRAEVDAMRKEFQTMLDRLGGKVAAGAVSFAAEVPPLGSGRIYAGRDGAIWVSVASSPGERTKRFDVFDSSLRYMGRVTGVPSDRLAAVSLNEAWIVEHQEVSGPSVARYTVTWRR
jgi:hypothetical protein